MKILSKALAIVFLFPVFILAQTALSTTPPTPDQEVYVFGIPLSVLMPLILAIIGALYTWLETKKAKLYEKKNKYIEDSLENELLEKALMRTSDAFLKSCEMAYQSMYKKMVSLNEDGKITESDIDTLHIFAKERAKELLPDTVKNTLKRHGLDNDKFYLSEIKRAVRKLKNDYRTFNNGKNIKPNKEK